MFYAQSTVFGSYRGTPEKKASQVSFLAQIIDDFDMIIYHFLIYDLFTSVRINN